MSNKPKRVKIDLDSSIAAALAAGPSQAKKPTAASDRPKATYDLHPDTIQAIREIAVDLGVPIYAVAQKMLDYALREYKLGRLELRRKAVTTAWSLE